MIIEGRLAVVVFAIAGGGCVDGPGFMKQSGAALPQALTLRTVAVSTVDRADGSATATLVPQEGATLVVAANKNSAIAGATVAFPPGTLPLSIGAVEVTLAPASTLVDSASQAAVTNGIPVVNAGAAVAITASVIGLVTDADFALTVPLPTQAAAGLLDPYENVVVLYAIEKNGSTVVGAFLRDQLEPSDGFAKIYTRHFGRYQAVILREPLKTKSEAVVDPPVTAESAPLRARYFVRGFATTAAGEGEARDSGLNGGFWHLSLGRIGIIGQDTVLRSER